MLVVLNFYGNNLKQRNKLLYFVWVCHGFISYIFTQSLMRAVVPVVRSILQLNFPPLLSARVRADALRHFGCTRRQW
ncbi:MAG: hypothetical protein EBU63_04025 [Alphaproteobacteria bacterium]|nr:hypothetical protein [Alphaproteobacteria bacterium]